MRFFNRHVLLYAFIVLTATLLLYLVALKSDHLSNAVTAAITIAYILIIAVSVPLIKRRDEYEGYFGFNYHLTTYLLCMAVPLLLKAMGVLADVRFLTTMALVWGLGIIVHLLIVLFFFRNRRLGSYDKKELFQ